MTRQTECRAPKSPWKQPGTWGLLCFLVLSGGLAGGSITQYLVLKDSAKQIAEIKAAYDEAGNSRLTALNMCLKNTSGAASAAASAANNAAAKAEQAVRAADKAAAAATGNDTDVPK